MIDDKSKRGDNSSVLFLILILIVSIVAGVSIYQLKESQTRIDKLTSDYIKRSSDYIKIYTDYNELDKKYSSLETEYVNLEEKYNEIFQQIELYDELRIGNSLASYYEFIRSEIGTNMKSEKEECTFAVCLALHDLHRLYWRDIEEQFSEDVGGESYDLAWQVLSKAYDHCEINSRDSDVEKIRKILEFVNWFIDYEHEVDDSKRAPVETLSLRTGDCDDFTILVGALFERAGIESSIARFENEDDEGHYMVLVHLDNLGEYRCWYYEDLQKYDLMKGKWIKIEPQRKIEQQHDEEWMSQWNLKMAVEIDYEKATS